MDLIKRIKNNAKNGLENIIHETNQLPDINEANRKKATIAGFLGGILISAKTSQLGSEIIKNSWGLSILSDALGFVGYQGLFVLTYLEENRDRYTKSEKYDLKKISVATYDLLVNMAPVNGISALVTFHLFRDAIQSTLMTNGYSPVVSSIFSDVILMPPYLALREGMLSYMPRIKKGISNSSQRLISYTKENLGYVRNVSSKFTNKNE